MRSWYALVCPVCGWRHPPRKFSQNPQPITYPAQLVTGGGRGSGFKVLSYLPWSELPRLRGRAVWQGIECLYSRLAAAYDCFFETLGYLSPKIRMLLQEARRSYTDAYPVELTYTMPYSNTFPDVARPYPAEEEYTGAYEALLRLQLATQGDKL